MKIIKTEIENVYKMLFILYHSIMLPQLHELCYIQCIQMRVFIHNDSEEEEKQSIHEKQKDKTDLMKWNQ